MKTSVTNLVVPAAIVAVGIVLAVGGIFVGEYDDAPGAAVLGLLLLIGAIVLAVRTARRKT